MKKEMYLVSEFCELYSISRESLYKEAAAGRIRIRTRGRRKLISHADAERWLNNLPIFTQTEIAPSPEPESSEQYTEHKETRSFFNLFKFPFRKRRSK